jgi:hypothetical protein
LRESKVFEEFPEGEEIPNFPEDQKFCSELDFNLIKPNKHYTNSIK